MNLISKALCLIIILMEILESSTIGNHYNRLVKYLKKESKLHHVVFLFDNERNNTDDSVSLLVKSINRNFPSSSIEYSKRRNKQFRVYLKSLRRSRKTALFVFVKDSVNVSTEMYGGFLLPIRGLSQSLPMPKCLIVHSHVLPDVNLNKTLYYLWKRDYLDVTILVYHEEESKSLKEKSDKQSFLHRLNPFTKKYTALQISTTSQWFPNKLKNLRGYPLKFLISDGNKSVSTKFSTGKKFAEILSHHMNFRPCIHKAIPHQKVSTQTLLNKKKAEMFLNTILFIEHLQINILELGYIMESDARAVIPRITKSSKVIVLSQEFLYMLLGTIGTICVLKLTAIMMRFNKRTWTASNISQMIMGLSVIEEPVEPTERIVFGTVLLACLVYTGYFFSAILDLSLQSSPEIETLAELATSSLTHVINSPTLYTSMTLSSNLLIRKLAQNSTVVPAIKSNLGCLLYLNDYQNVSCISGGVIAHVNHIKELKGEFNGKMLSEPVAHVTEGFVSRDNSPFTDRFREIIVKASEHGFIAKLFKTVKLEHQIVELPQEIEKEKLLLISLYVLSIGFSLSILAFLFEIFASIIGERMFAFLRSLI
ncbi:uncharacterized protein LOC122505356 [Leptopilina heterotoma]|uniref:uncharacterized protein LOC122505356 n=1 Tax=Leptopilina heterotoma TaxID=63436 RepID=UPI001CA7E14B|nr:uncharacterized protein LOC122505356 [Leptopilina heterotoma]